MIMSTVKQAIQLLEAGNRRYVHAARLFKTNGNSGVAFELKEKGSGNWNLNSSCKGG